MASLASTPFAPFRRPRIRLRLCSSPSSLCLCSPPFLFISLSLSLSFSVAFIVFLYPLSTSSLVLSRSFLFPSNRLFSSFHFVSFAFSLSLKQPPSVSLVLLDTNGQSKLRHYEVPCTEVTPLRSHHFGSTNTAATLGRSPHLESGMRERGLSSLTPPSPFTPAIPAVRQLSSFMAAQEGHQNLLRRCPNWYSVLKRVEVEGRGWGGGCGMREKK